jgi:hypothetical protein
VPWGHTGEGWASGVGGPGMPRRVGKLQDSASEERVNSMPSAQSPAGSVTDMAVLRAGSELQNQS